ncbi:MULTISPECIES: transposase [unclassified Ectothiorhodospira]|uniref:transposase n=1 Tax=unclassified Ectothiorhodospira TaxID=2684909 RepID=UPI001EE9AE0B|nr:MULTISPECIES: transposase [unclassified Ectothiorhodospira]MCG5517402.1 transposase [Ectothiorhodospira sp. 9100]MCG5520310.1 transposase [Ectothiorhodospira sp. 9905]
MTRARHQLICPEATSYYHTISRCVRRAFLCGEDSLTGKNHEHRKTWVTQRLRELADAFAIEICAYAIMSSHYHLVLRIDQGTAKQWDSEQVIEHWGRLYSVPVLVTRYQRGETTSKAENIKAEEIIETWRERLTDISWFMRSLNEYLARRANEEDHCKGHFWESRFKSQALLDDAAVLACMSYVDLNPVRAKMADTPEASDFTSIQQRIRDVAPKQTKPTDEAPIKAIPLMRLVPQRHDPHPNSIGFTLPDYLELVDWAGREIREGKPGSINAAAPPILERLHLDPHRLMDHLRGEAMIEKPVMLGSVEKLKQTVATFERKFVKGISEARRLFRPPIVT